jgi:alpha-galactosidase
VQKRWQEDPVDWFDRYFEEAVDTVETIRRASDPSSDLFSIVPPEPSGETIIPLIDSIANDIPRVLIVNTTNRGSYVPGIPQDFAVEIPALVSARGIEGIQTNPLPKTILAHALHDRVAPVETELEAYENGDYESLLQLILMDPWTKSEAQARALIDNVLNLPYHTEMKDHYRRRSN